MINEIFELHKKGMGQRKIASTLGISRNTVKSYILKLVEADFLGPERAEAKEAAEAKQPYSAPWSPLIDWSAVKVAVDKGYALTSLHEKLLQKSEDPRLNKVPNITFWREFKRRFPDFPIDFHKSHPPGVRAEADFKGADEGLGYYDKQQGGFVQCRLFGNILCFSQFFYAEAMVEEKQSDWLSGMANSFSYFGGVPQTQATDNAKAVVQKAGRYDPDFNPEYWRFAAHYRTAPIAARPRCPKDKNLIENVLGVFWRWAGPQVRDRKFYSISDLNSYIRELLEEFNGRVMKKYGQSRRERLALELDSLLPVPEGYFEYGTWKKAKVHPDSHVQVNHNFYSVSHAFRGQEVDVRVTRVFVEIFMKTERIALHHRAPSIGRGRYFTIKEHLPEAHLALLEACPRRCQEQAAGIGEYTSQIVSSLLNQERNPLIFLRRVQGIIRLAAKHSPDALERSCRALVDLGILRPKLHQVEDLLKSPLQGQAPEVKSDVSRGANPHLRGQSFWGQTQTQSYH